MSEQDISVLRIGPKNRKKYWNFDYNIFQKGGSLSNSKCVITNFRVVKFLKLKKFPEKKLWNSPDRMLNAISLNIIERC